MDSAQVASCCQAGWLHLQATFPILQNMFRIVWIFISNAQKLIKYPKVFDCQYVFEYQMNIQTILYCYDKIITRAALSRLTGINERQLGHYICGRSHPMKKQQERIVNALHSLGKELQSVTA